MCIFFYLCYYIIFFITYLQVKSPWKLIKITQVTASTNTQLKLSELVENYF